MTLPTCPREDCTATCDHTHVLAVLMFAEIAAADLPSLLNAAAERDALAAKVERVRALHNRQPSRLTGDYCAADGDDYPCLTLRALDGGER